MSVMEVINGVKMKEWDVQSEEGSVCSQEEADSWEDGVELRQIAQVMVWCRGECDGRMGFESFNFISSASVWGL